MKKTVYFLDLNCPDAQGEPTLFVTSQEEWETNHCLSDSETDQEVLNELEAGGFPAGEIMDSTLEFYPPPDIEALIIFLQEHPDFVESDEFANFLSMSYK